MGVRQGQSRRGPLTLPDYRLPSPDYRLLLLDSTRARAQQALEIVLIDGGAGGHVPGDDPLAEEIDQRPVHRLHSLLRAGLDAGVELLALALADQIADAGGDDHRLHRRHPAAAD